MKKTPKQEAFEELANRDEEGVIDLMRGGSSVNYEGIDDPGHSPELLSSIDNSRKKKRRGKKRHTARNIILILLLALLITLVVNLIMNRSFTVSFYQVTCDKVSDNIRVVELADLHNAQFGEGNKKLIDRIAELKPDLIIYAGDMMNYKNSDYSVLFDLSDKLCEIAPIYACFGNNELDQYLYEDKTFKSQFAEHNVTLLSNEAMDVQVRDTTLQFIAISDDVTQFDIPTNNAKKFLEGLEPTDNCRICLTHYPELFKSKLLYRDIDIAFTGHAHGGLIRIPKLGGLYSNGEGFLPKLTAGVETMEDGAQVVISRGLGNSGYVPRINNQPELVVVDICWY